MSACEKHKYNCDHSVYAPDASSEVVDRETLPNGMLTLVGAPCDSSHRNRSLEKQAEENKNIDLHAELHLVSTEPKLADYTAGNIRIPNKVGEVVLTEAAG
jgi:hypothetical protein